MIHYTDRIKESNGSEDPQLVFEVSLRKDFWFRYRDRDRRQQLVQQGKHSGL